MPYLRIDIKIEVEIRFTDCEDDGTGEADRLVITNERGEITMAEIIRPGKKRTLTLTALRGTAPPVPARLDGEPVWTADVEGIVSLFPAPGGMSVDVGFIAAGTAKITVKADADLTAGERLLTEFVEVVCREEEAERLAIVVGPEIDL